MNRVEFIELTNSKGIVSMDDIINYFDYVMTAYDITKNVSINSMQSSIDNFNSSLRIQITSSDFSDINPYINQINNIITYGKAFDVKVDSNEENKIELVVRESV